MNPYIGIFRRCESLYIRSKMEKYGLLPLECKLIILLQDRCSPQDELGHRLNIDKGRIARSISVLEEKRLIFRETNNKDKRQKFVSLTEAGEQMLVQISKVYDDWDEICYVGFTDEEKELHKNFLKRIAENAMEYKRCNANQFTGAGEGSRCSSADGRSEAQND